MSHRAAFVAATAIVTLWFGSGIAQTATTGLTVKANNAGNWRVENYRVSTEAAGEVLQIRAELYSPDGHEVGIYDQARWYTKEVDGPSSVKGSKWTSQREVLIWNNESFDITTNPATGASEVVFNGAPVGGFSAKGSPDQRMAGFLRHHEQALKLLQAVREDIDRIAQTLR